MAEKAAEVKDRPSEMDLRKVGLEFINFARASTQATLDTLNLLQDQSQRVLNLLMTQGVNIQQEYQKLFKEWTENAKKGTEAYQKILDNSFKMAESFFRT